MVSTTPPLTQCTRDNDDDGDSSDTAGDGHGADEDGGGGHDELLELELIEHTLCAACGSSHFQ